MFNKTLVWFRFTQSMENTDTCRNCNLPYVNTIAGMSWMRDSYPLHRCFHETHYTLKRCHHTNFVLNLNSIYRAQYAFATLKKLVFLLPPHDLPRKLSSARTDISCGCPVREHQDQQILLKFLAVH